jgi:tetratricopeptide (TPR) repeat protein
MRNRRKYIGFFISFVVVHLVVYSAWFIWRLRAHDAAEPLFTGLGGYHRTITTTSSAAQQRFDEGLAFRCVFQHNQAINSFRGALKSDQNCAMALWGIAMAVGPDINSTTVTESHARTAWAAATKALELSGNASLTERALYGALIQRWSDPPVVNRRSLDEAYARAMRDVWRTYPDDPDVGALTAEAILDLRPWDQWTRDGKPQPGTEEAIQILRAVLEKSPRHPFALHLMVHALEASPHPEQADDAADKLRNLAPGLDHLVHMPSHIDVRCGRWQQAVECNEKAISAAKAFRARIPPCEFYGFSLIHDCHMLAFAAAMQGQRQKSTNAIQDLVSDIPLGLAKERAEEFDVYIPMQQESDLRFGEWNEVLARPKPDPCFHFATGVWHYARGTALAAKGRLREAKAEEHALASLKQSLSKEAYFRNVPIRILLSIPEQLLAGEVAYREGKVDLGVAYLQKAVQNEEALPYHEPPIWLMPPRHVLGATLMDARRYSEAEAVYREDLRRYPENGWSLYGLAASLRRQEEVS